MVSGIDERRIKTRLIYSSWYVPINRWARAVRSEAVSTRPIGRVDPDSATDNRFGGFTLEARRLIGQTYIS